MKTEFTAKLDGIELDDAAKLRIAAGLQGLVVQELARLDKKGDLVVKRPIRLGPTNGIVAIDKEGTVHINQLT